MSRTSTARAAGAVLTSPRSAHGYFQRSELPLASLAFLLPFIILYELGTYYFAFDPVYHSEQRIIAFNLMARFFHACGATGRYLPALAVVFILLGCHIARRDAWQIDVRHMLGMLIESLLLAVPLIAMGFVAARYLPLAGLTRPTSSMIVLSIGAGIYEELIFRLIAFNVLSLVLIDWLGLRKTAGYLLMVVVTSLAFSLYHYLGNEPFQVRSFAFRTVAGFYFGAVFLFRGFGITAGTHAAYDILVVTLRSIA